VPKTTTLNVFIKLFLVDFCIYCPDKVFIILLHVGGYSPNDCWRGGSHCDLVTLLKISPLPGHSQYPGINTTKAASGFDLRPEYVFHGLGQEFHIVLRPDTMVLQDKQRNMSMVLQDKQRNMSMPDGAACFYSGHVKGYNGSSVAVSLCKGMVSCSSYLSCIQTAVLYNLSIVARTHPYPYWYLPYRASAPLDWWTHSYP
jgi:hypothetical protein